MEEVGVIWTTQQQVLCFGTSEPSPYKVLCFILHVNHVNGAPEIVLVLNLCYLSADYILF